MGLCSCVLLRENTSTDHPQCQHVVSLASIFERLPSECEHNSVQQQEVGGVCELLEEIYSVYSIAYTLCVFFAKKNFWR